MAKADAEKNQKTPDEIAGREAIRLNAHPDAEQQAEDGERLELQKYRQQNIHGAVGRARMRVRDGDLREERDAEKRQQVDQQDAKQCKSSKRIQVAKALRGVDRAASDYFWRSCQALR